MIMWTPTAVFVFFALCGAGILLSPALPARRQGDVLAWVGCLASVALVLAGADLLLTGATFNQPLWPVSGLSTLTLSLDTLSAVFLLVTGLVLFPASLFAGSELNRISKTGVRPDEGSGAPVSDGRVFTMLMLALYASIGLVFLSGDVLLFLLAWEVMSILCYLLIVSSR
jgi:formate hydrogenlyase subunit 3/multisubunit Na+/H+ antiporter MnhD subunit